MNAKADSLASLSILSRSDALLFLFCFLVAVVLLLSVIFD